MEETLKSLRRTRRNMSSERRDGSGCGLSVVHVVAGCMTTLSSCME